MKLLALMMFALLAAGVLFAQNDPCGAFPHCTVLTWTASPTPDVTYNVFRGSLPGQESTTPINSLPVTALTYTDGIYLEKYPADYYYIVVAVNSAGASGPSNEATVHFPKKCTAARKVLCKMMDWGCCPG